MPRPHDRLQRPPSTPEEPPAPAGDTLADFSRRDGSERVRVSHESLGGRPFIRCRVYRRGANGRWWPVPERSVSFTLSEARELVQALGRLAPDAMPRREFSPWSTDARPEEGPQAAARATHGAPADPKPVEPRSRAVGAPTRSDRPPRAGSRQGGYAPPSQPQDDDRRPWARSLPPVPEPGGAQEFDEF